MQCKCSMSLDFCLSEEKFSLDTLVLKLTDLFQKKAFAQILHLVLMLIQEVLVMRLIRDKGKPCTCGCGHWQLNGSFKRRIGTRLGAVELIFQRVRCSRCGESFAPMQKLMRLGKYQTKTNELEKLVCETVSETSYRRGMNQLARDTGRLIPYHTAHDWVMKTNCDEITLSKEELEQPLEILPDGTCFKGEPEGGAAHRGDLKIVVAVTASGKILPVEGCAGMSWQEIHDRLKEKQYQFANGSIVICDGELGLAENFADFTDEQQRCLWHIKRDLYFSMHNEGAKTEAIKDMQHRLAGTMAIELPDEDFEKASEEDKATLKERMDKAEAEVLQFISDLENRGYAKAAAYLHRARVGMFGYVRRWLKWGMVSPKASSMIERVMREIGLRVKKIGYGWKDHGITKIARIVLKRFASKSAWEDYWKKVFGEDMSVIIQFKILKGKSQTFAH